MEYLGCGWGPPAESLARSADFITNGSRIMYRRSCNEAGALRYDDNLMPFVPEGDDHIGALYFGSAWHDAMDRIFVGESAPSIIAEYHMRTWQKPAEQLMFERGLAAYWHHYGGKPANGKLLASEQSFWIYVEVAGATFLVLGRYDRLCEWSGVLINGEIKTVDPRRKFDVWYTMRSNSVQEAIYNWALFRLPRKLPNGVELPEATLGTRYDVFFKKAYPSRSVKTEAAKAKLRLEQDSWTDGRFRVVPLTHIDERAETIIHRELLDYTADLKSRSQNHNACYTFGVCPYLEICHKGAPKDSTLYTQREPDYVDALAG